MTGRENTTMKDDQQHNALRAEPEPGGMLCRAAEILTENPTSTSYEIAAELGLPVDRAGDIETGWCDIQAGGDLTRYLGSVPEALSHAEDDVSNWADASEETEWHEVSATKVLIYVGDGTAVLIDGESDSATVRVDAEEPDCDHAAGHEWESPPNIGCEAVGVGGGVIITDVCVRCACGRTRNTRAHDPSTGSLLGRSVAYAQWQHCEDLVAVAEKTVEEAILQSLADDGAPSSVDGSRYCMFEALDDASEGVVSSIYSGIRDDEAWAVTTTEPTARQRS